MPTYTVVGAVRGMVVVPRLATKTDRFEVVRSTVSTVVVTRQTTTSSAFW